MKKSFIVFVLFVVVILMTVDCYAFRCGGDIVSEGDSAAAVYSKCGSPSWKETVEIKSEGTFGGQVDRWGNFGGQYQEKTKKVDKWYYNCGQFDFIYVLTIEGGIVISIENERRGTGKSQCNGDQ